LSSHSFRAKWPPRDQWRAGAGRGGGGWVNSNANRLEAMGWQSSSSEIAIVLRSVSVYTGRPQRCISVRDEFSAKTIRTLAARVGYHCSNPTCVRSTSGPALDEAGTVNIGVGAHIAAADIGGKRYDARMSSSERSSGNNGIWLCQNCSKLIDSDEDRYTVALLHQWKVDAIQRTRDAIASGRPLGAVKPSDSIDAADEAFLSGLDLPSADAVDTVRTRLRAATQNDIGAFRAERGRPARTIVLTLRLEGNTTAQVTLESVGRLTTLAEPVAVIAPGGTGKSTTLVQLAECMSAEDNPIPLLVPLGEWSDRQEDFFDFTLRRNAFGTFRRQHLMQLAYQGRLALLLDGWNELTPEARLRATHDLTALHREYPQLGVVISSRRQALPIVGPVIAIEALSQDQQMELARAARGEEGIEFLDQAWRTSGVRELVAIPLYLNALLTLESGAAFPETKEAVLRMFARHNEAAPDKVERLQRDTLGQHTAMLVGLAAEANRSANTVISNTNANRTVATILRQLSEDGQIGAPPHPHVIIDGLVGAHLLVRSPGADGAVSFQHQLFQEWYAASEVEDLMTSALRSADACERLREGVLNQPSWEESILFACDRLSRASEGGTRAVAAAIGETLGIDPLLAAAMLDRAADAVWQLLRDRVLSFVGRWHMPGTFDRAARFMIASGKSEFADVVWPLATNTDHQIQYQTFRSADRFRPSVLGPDRVERLRTLPAEQRRLALTEIASNSGLDGMELAASLAATDPDPEVVVHVVESLAFRRGDRHVNLILRAAPDGVWNALGKVGYPDHLTDPQLDARLAAAREAARSTETDPLHLLYLIADAKPADAEAQIVQLLAAGEVGSKDMNFERAIARIYPVFPGAVAAGLVERIASNLPLPYRTSDYLNDAPLLDVGPVAEASLDPSTPRDRLNAAAAVIGPVTVAALFEQLFAIDGQIQALNRYDEQLSNSRGRLVGALTGTRQNVFVAVLVANARGNDPQRIKLLADLLAGHGGTNGDSRRPINAVHRADLLAVINIWLEALLTAPRLERHAASVVARAVGRLAFAELAEPLYALLERDVADYEASRKARLEARGQGRPVEIGYGRVYANALAAMHEASAVAVLTRSLGDLRWGIDAAGALLEIWSVDHPPEEKRGFGSWTDYSQHLSRRAERAAGVPPSCDFAEAIFEVVRTLGKPAKADAEQQHALALAGIGLALPHGAKRREIDALLALPQPITHKRPLLTAAARAGEIIPASFLTEGLRNLLAAAQTQRWRLEENSGELMGWIDLFPFSDNPEGVHDAIALLPDARRRPRELRRLLVTVPQGPAGQALTTLERLAMNDPAFLREFEWLNAALTLGSEAAAMAVLNHLCADQIPVGDGFRLSRALTSSARAFDNVRAAMIGRYRALPPGDVRRVFEMAMNDLTNEDVFWALFDGHVHAQHPFRGVAHALRNLAIGRRPSREWVGAVEEFGQPLAELRAKLFAMLPVNDARAQLAKQCLIAIEELRDEAGRVSSEPRHPDIATGRAWPPEAQEPSYLAV
jgi:hypothetical protein